MNRWTIAGAALLACTLVALAVDPRVFFAVWLAAWWWGLGLVLGALANAWVHRLSSGRWGDAVREVALPLAQRMPWLVLLAIPVAAGAPWLYPWAADPGGGWASDLAHPWFLQMWMAPWFVGARAIAYAVLWWLLARAWWLGSKGRAAAAVVVYGLVTSLAAVDLLMSMMPGWISTAFPLLALIAQALGGAGLVVLLLSHARAREIAAPREKLPPLSRDLGNLMLTWTLMWTYVAFMEYLIIWAEDLPREIRWYLPRFDTGWYFVGYAVAIAQFALPFLALLWRSVKDRPNRLAWVAALVVVANALDTAWIVVPSFVAHSVLAAALLPVAFAGMAALLVGGLPATLRMQAPPARGAEVRHA